MDHSSHMKEIITRFLQGVATEEEIKDLHAWLEDDELNRIYFDEVNTAYQASVTLNFYSQQKTDSAWNKITQKVKLENGRPEKNAQHALRLSFAMRMAASVCLIIVAGYFTFKLVSKREQVQNSIAINAQGKNMRVVLPDGTLVWLNSNSSLEYASVFGNEQREVILKGEAFFDVRKNAKPFIVKAGSIQVHVKGTKFNVQAYKEDQSIKTTLEEGKIELLVEGRNLEMKPGDQVTVNTKLGKITSHQVNPSNFSAWKEEQLHFDNASLIEILTKLENRYKVTIEADSTIAMQEHLTMTIENESLDEVLHFIGMSSRLKVERKDKKIFLYPNNQN